MPCNTTTSPATPRTVRNTPAIKAASPQQIGRQSLSLRSTGALRLGRSADSSSSGSRSPRHRGLQRFLAVRRSTSGAKIAGWRVPIRLGSTSCHHTSARWWSTRRQGWQTRAIPQPTGCASTRLTRGAARGGPVRPPATARCRPAQRWRGPMLPPTEGRPCAPFGAGVRQQVLASAAKPTQKAGRLPAHGGDCAMVARMSGSPTKRAMGHLAGAVLLILCSARWAGRPPPPWL